MPEQVIQGESHQIPGETKGSVYDVCLCLLMEWNASSMFTTIKIIHIGQNLETNVTCSVIVAHFNLIYLCGSWLYLISVISKSYHYLSLLCIHKHDIN